MAKTFRYLDVFLWGVVFAAALGWTECFARGPLSSTPEAVVPPFEAPQEVTRIFDNLKVKTLKDYFLGTLAEANDLSAPLPEAKELDAFNTAYLEYVKACGEIGFFGKEGPLGELLDRNPERDRYIKWFHDNESQLLSRAQIRQFEAISFQEMLRETYDAYNLQQYSKDHDPKSYFERATAFLNSPYVQQTLQFAHNFVTSPIIVVPATFFASTLFYGPMMQFSNNFFGKPMDPINQWAATVSNKLWARPAMWLQSQLNSTTKKATKQLLEGQKAQEELVKIDAELKFKGMTHDQALKNWDRLVHTCVVLNQTFSETTAQINGGRGTIFGFSMDAHRNYATSMAVFHANLENHSLQLGDILRRADRRAEIMSDIHEHEMRLAMLPEGSAEYLQKKEQVQVKKLEAERQRQERADLIKQIVQDKYVISDLPTTDANFAEKTRDFELRAQELARRAGLTDDELGQVIRNAGEIRLAQKQSAAALAEWIYFEFSHPEIRKAATKNQYGKEFLGEYFTVRNWLGYDHYLEANKRDLQDLLNKIHFSIDLNVIAPARETLIAAGKMPDLIKARESATCTQLWGAVAGNGAL